MYIIGQYLLISEQNKGYPLQPLSPVQMYANRVDPDVLALSRLIGMFTSTLYLVEWTCPASVLEECTPEEFEVNKLRH